MAEGTGCPTRRTAQHAVSNAEPNWALARSPEWTINRFHTVVAPLGEGAASGLAAGRHLLTVVCRGETLPEIVHLPTNYSRHEVHVRGVVGMRDVEMLDVEMK